MQKQPQQEAALLTWSEQQDSNPRMMPGRLVFTRFGLIVCPSKVPGKTLVCLRHCSA